MVDKKILIITYYWPPSGGSGVQRWLNLSNYLVDMGCDVTVLSPEFANYPILDNSLINELNPLIKILKVPVFEPAKFFKSKTNNSDNIENRGILNYFKLFIRSNFFFPDSRMFWINDVVKSASSCINKNNINCVITTSPPFSLNIIGYKLKLKNNIKWISDYRDPWSDFFQFKKMPMFSNIRKKHFDWEKKCLKTADSVLVTSPSLKTTYSKINPNTHLITNGFDTFKKTIESTGFEIIYSGVMKSSQNPKMLWKVLAEISMTNKSFKKDFKLSLIGNFDKSIHQNKYLKKLKEQLVFKSYMKKDDLEKKLSFGKVFILCDVNQPGGGNLIPGKFFHYLSYEIPIVAFSSKNSDTSNIINETKSGNVFEFSNEIELKNHILELYTNFKNGSYSVKSIGIEKYKFSNLSSELLTVIKKNNRLVGIVFKQTSWNILTISIAILIGGVNTLYFYPEFLKDNYYGLVVFLLATSNLLQPLMSFGAQHTIIKFFSSFNDKKEKDQFLSSVIFLPLFFIIPITFLVVQFHDLISQFLSVENPIIESYIWVIFLVSFATSYFEVFYSWSRVQFKSIFGNVLKEIYPRISVLFLLILVSVNVLSKENFVWWLTGLYYLRLVLMIIYSFYLYTPEFSIKVPENYKEILSYSFYILLAGSAASFLIDIDKYMIPQKEAISQTAYYAVAVFIATVVEIPGRAMFQILNPLVAKALNEENYFELKNLYKNSSENLLLVSGLFFLLINLNIDSFYLLLNNQFYSNASLVVLIISSAKLIQMSFGCGPAILATSTFYRITLPFSISMAVSVYFLNDYLIDLYGINGAAISTFVVLLVFTLLKILYISFKIKIQPYNLNSIKILFAISVVYLTNYFIETGFNPLVEIIIRSIGILIMYVVLIYILGISQKLKNLLSLKF